MKTKEKTKLDFERQSQFQSLGRYFSNQRNFRGFENEQFIVPWQMEKIKKGELFVE